jgi:hypothetical protein
MGKNPFTGSFDSGGSRVKIALIAGPIAASLVGSAGEWGAMARVSTGLIVGAAVCACLQIASMQTAAAGPCSGDIAQFEAAIRQSAGNPNAGLTAAQSVGAQIDRQPTAESVQQAEARLQAQFAATMARAKRLDARGDRTGCTRALTAAKRMYLL